MRVGSRADSPNLFIQFRPLSTSLFLAIHGIMPRSLAPTSSIWWLVVQAADRLEARLAGAVFLHPFAT